MLDKEIHAGIKGTLELAQKGFANIFVAQLSISINRTFGAETTLSRRSRLMEVERHFDDRLTPLEMFVRNSCVDARDAPAHNSIAHFESLEVGEDGKYLYLLKAQKILLTSEFIPGSTLFSDLLL